MGQYILSDLMKLFLNDTSPIEKLHQPLIINAVISELPYIPDITVIDMLTSIVNITTDDVCGDGTTGWNDSSISGVMTARDRAVICMSINAKLSILTKEKLLSR